MTKPPQPTAWISVPRRPSWWQTTPVASTQRSSEWIEAWDSYKLQIPGLSYNRWGSQAWDTLQDSTDNSSSNKVEPVWNDRSICLSSKIRLMCSLVASIFLYACESWTLTAKLQRIQAMEMRCYHKILHTSYKDHVANEKVCAKIQQAIGPQEDLLTIVKRHKLQWYGHVSRSSNLAKITPQGTAKGERRQGGQRKRWEDNIREWIGLEFGRAEGSGEQGKVEESGG